MQTVVTLYDLIPLVFDEHYLRDPVMRERYMVRTRMVREADRVLAISRTTGEDAVERLQVDPAASLLSTRALRARSRRCTRREHRPSACSRLA